MYWHVLDIELVGTINTNQVINGNVPHVTSSVGTYVTVHSLYIPSLTPIARYVHMYIALVCHMYVQVLARVLAWIMSAWTIP
jgi:hypothetical protein